MPKPQLTPQVPTQEAAAPKRYTLPSGDIASLEMPDLFNILATVGVVPDPITAAVIKLLIGEGAYVPEEDGRYYKYKADEIRGMYGLYSLCRKDKRLDLDRAHGDGNGVLGRLDVAYNDLLYVLNVFFRSGSAIAVDGVPAAVDALGAAQPASDSRDVPQAAE